ncbi:hypothetical protein [Rhodococcoides fascians]|uniref:hypothetical protein n=1 Tax=Rhodococcoides fascians TaxID=1828 RepID=UPI00050CFCD8|nr:hypothetical protein [Rhodococcus fascians]
MNITRIVHTVAQLDDGSFVVLNEAGEPMTTFTVEPDREHTSDDRYAITMASVFRRMFGNGSLTQPF